MEHWRLPSVERIMGTNNMSEHKNDEVVSTSADLQIHYNEIYRLCCAENDLLDILAKADEDVKSGRVAPMKDTFDDLRNDILLSIKDRII